jgi:hypothetical protein
MGTIFDGKHAMMSRFRAHPCSAITCLIILAAFQTFGCSTTRPLVEAFSNAEQTLRLATEARANHLAPMELQRAMDTLEAAKRAMSAGKYDDVRRLAEIAQVEAELAEAKADAVIMRLAADKLRQSGNPLRQEPEAARRGASTE